MSTILITGGTGVIGKYLSEKLKEKGYNVSILSRTSSNETDIRSYAWKIDKNEIEHQALETADYIIHLAGTSIGDKRWSTKRKQQIIDSRVKSAELIFEKLKENKSKPKAFISASAIGFYGTITSDKILTETDPPANDFLGNTCRQWEQSADRFEELGIRTVKIRTGLVLTKQGGVLAKLLLPIRFGIGSAIGNGQQYMPWIHIDDLCGIYIKAIEDAQMNGAYNAVAPKHVANKEFTKTLACVLNKPYWFLNIPSILLKMIFGEMSEILLKGSRVSSEKISSAGYSFKFTHLESALSDILTKKHNENSLNA